MHTIRQPTSFLFVFISFVLLITLRQNAATCFFFILISCLSSFLLQRMRRDGISRCICILCYYVTCWLCHLLFSLQIRNYAVFFATKCLYRHVLQEVSTFIYLAFFFTFVVCFVTSLLSDVTYSHHSFRWFLQT